MKKHRSGIVFLIVLPICFLAIVVTIYFLSDNFSGLFVRRYDKRPEFSSAPVPIDLQSGKHYVSSSECGGEQIDDLYYVNTPADEVEEHYRQEMEKHCLSRQGWQVIFSTMKCWSGDDSIGTLDCRYAACVLRDQAPSLYESFSVEIFSVSSTRTYVWQNQTMFYLSTTPSDVQCGE